MEAVGVVAAAKGACKCKDVAVEMEAAISTTVELCSSERVGVVSAAQEVNIMQSAQSVEQLSNKVVHTNEPPAAAVVSAAQEVDVVQSAQSVEQQSNKAVHTNGPSDVVSAAQEVDVVQSAQSVERQLNEVVPPAVR